jgi:hypothetical protein
MVMGAPAVENAPARRLADLQIGCKSGKPKADAIPQSRRGHHKSIVARLFRGGDLDHGRLKTEPKEASHDTERLRNSNFINKLLEWAHESWKGKPL